MKSGAKAAARVDDVEKEGEARWRWFRVQEGDELIG